MTVYFSNPSPSRTPDELVFRNEEDGSSDIVSNLRAFGDVTSLARAPDGQLYAAVRTATFDGPAGTANTIVAFGNEGERPRVLDTALEGPLSGLAFDGHGLLYGAITGENDLTDIVQLDPATFATIGLQDTLDLGTAADLIDLTVSDGTIWATGTADGRPVLRPADGSDAVFSVDAGRVEGLATMENGKLYIDAEIGSDLTFDPATGTFASPGAARFAASDTLTSDAYGSAQPEIEKGVKIEGGPGDDGIVGTNGNDVLVGGEGDDMLFGLGGDDLLRGDGGDDILFGDGNDAPGGSDSIYGGLGDDVIFAGGGNDFVYAGAGDDQVAGDDGDDLIDLAQGDDIAFGGAGADLIQGATGNDVVFAEAGNDRVNGGSGDDAIAGGTGADELNGEGGDDLLYGEEGDDILRGGLGDDQMAGGEGDDRLRGDDGNDVLFGERGDDSFQGGGGIDVFFGGEGADTVILDPRGGRDFWADYEDGVDRIEARSIGATRDGFAEKVSIVAVEGATYIGFADSALFLEGVDAASITIDDFNLIDLAPAEEADGGA